MRTWVWITGTMDTGLLPFKIAQFQSLEKFWILSPPLKPLLVANLLFCPHARPYASPNHAQHVHVFKVVPSTGPPQTWPICFSTLMLAPFQPHPCTSCTVHVSKTVRMCGKMRGGGAACAPLANLTLLSTISAGKWHFLKPPPILLPSWT